MSEYKGFRISDERGNGFLGIFNSHSGGDLKGVKATPHPGYKPHGLEDRIERLQSQGRPTIVEERCLKNLNLAIAGKPYEKQWDITSPSP